MVDYTISHRTTYRYTLPVIQSNHILHLSPRPTTHQLVARHKIDVSPTPRVRRERIDYFGNPTTHLLLDQDHDELSVTATSSVSVNDQPAPDFSTSSPWDAISARNFPEGHYPTREIFDFACLSRHTQPTPEVRTFAKQLFEPGLPVLVGAQRMMTRIFETFQFDNATTIVSTPVNQVLEQKSGVCQDFAHLQIAAMRALGLPVRYVSGYIRTAPPEGEKKLEGTDASHAWVSVWAPGLGWVDFDPTNNLINSEDHITIAYGRDFDDVSPISGVLLGGGPHTVHVAVDVRPEPTVSDNGTPDGETILHPDPSTNSARSDR